MRAVRAARENVSAYDPFYAYDPRLVKIDDAYYVIWCTEFSGEPSIGLSRTKDFRTFTRLENVFLPYNRNGVQFPRKIDEHYMMLSCPSDTGHTPFGDIFVSESDDLVHWGMHRKVRLQLCHGTVGPGGTLEGALQDA